MNSTAAILLAICATRSRTGEAWRINKALHLAERDTPETWKKSTDNQETQWDANLYQDRHSFVWKYGFSLIDILDPQPEERILDVGCGSGELTNKISQRGAFAVGIDKDQNMVDKAQEQFPNITFFQANVQQLAFEEERYDAIFSNAALHWVTDPGLAVSAMAKALKPGGRFVVELGGKGNIQQIVQASNHVLGYPSTRNPYYFPSIPEFSNLLETHGIEVLSASLFDRPTVLEGGEGGMKNWLRMFGFRVFGELPEEQFDSVLEQVNAILTPKMYDGEKWTADYRRLRIVGNKIRNEEE